MRYIIWIALGLVMAGCSTPVTTQQTPGSTAVTTAPVKRQDLTGYSFFDGKLVIPPSAEANAYAAYDTPVDSVVASLGTHVGRGEPIVKLTIPGADEATTVAKANLNSAASDLSSARAQAFPSLQQAEKAVRDARAAEDAAKQTVAAGGTADVDAATQTRVDAENALQQAQQQMNQAVQPGKQEVQASAAELDEVKADARKGIVRAPITGTVVSMQAKQGMTPKSGDMLATIIDFDAARVQAVVPPELKDTVKRGTPVIIAMNSQNSKPLDGRVRSVSVMPPSQGQSSTGYLANIVISNTRGLSDPNPSVKRVGVKTGFVSNALVVPVAAVVLNGNKPTVYVQNGSQWTATPVQTGLSDGALIEIKSGLSEGQIVRVGS